VSVVLGALAEQSPDVGWWLMAAAAAGAASAQLIRVRRARRRVRTETHPAPRRLVLRRGVLRLLRIIRRGLKAVATAAIGAARALLIRAAVANDERAPTPLPVP